MSEGNQRTRRNVIKAAAGTALAGSGLSISVSADSGVTTEEAGVSERYQSLLDQCRFKEARKLLNRSGVDYTRRKYTEPVFGSEEDDLSAEDWFPKGDAEVVFETAPFDGDEYYLTLQWDNSYQSRGHIDLPGPKDIGALRYTPQVFTYSDDSLKHSGKMIVDYFNGGKIEMNNVTSVKNEQEGNGGSYGSSIYFDDRFTPDEGGSIQAKGYMQIRVRRIQNEKATVGGSYSHAWSPAGIGGGLLHDVQIALGTITFNTSVAVDNWRLPGNDKRDQTL